jgi:CRISPR-associated protein Csa5
MYLDELAKVLAVLIAEGGNYTYVDKLGYAPSKDLAIFYLKEALRDLHSIKNQERLENTKAKELLDKINFETAERALDELARVEDRRVLKEKTSLIGAKALAISAGLRGE